MSLAAALGRVLAADLAAPIDVPPFDRANVDGFALRAADTTGATDHAPKQLSLNAEVIACGHAPKVEVRPGTATTIATGGVLPRGADAVVMIEHTELIESVPAIELRRASAAGQFISYAGSDIARGETLMRKGQVIGSREIGMLAACGLAHVEVVRKPKVAVLSTGDELVPPGDTLRPGGVYDSNGAIVAAAVTEAGGEPVPFGAFPDDPVALEQAVRRALADCDMVVLSGGTSKGAGDLSHRIVSQLGKPGILVHGVALKPGKPLCLAVADGKPIAVLPGFPTSAIFTFHAFVAPVIRARAGLPPEAAQTIEARVPLRIASEMGRKEFVLVSLVADAGGAVAFPSAKGSGAVTSFSQADGFIEIDALAATLDEGTRARVTLIGDSARAPDVVIMGSHDIALDVVVGALADRGFSARTIAVGSQGGVSAATRGQCDVAPVHLVDPATGVYNRHLLAPGLSLVKGWQRMQGVLFRPGDKRFEGKTRGGRGEDGAGRCRVPDGQPQCRRGHPHPDRQAGRQRPPAGLCQPAEVAQRGGRSGGTGARRLGRGDRAGREDVRARLPAARAGALRLPAGREPARTARGESLPRGAARQRNARTDRGVGHAAE